MEVNKEHIIAQWIEGSISDEHLDNQYDVELSGDLGKIRDIADRLEVPEIDSKALLGKIKADISASKTNKVLTLKYWISGIAAILIGVLAYTALLDDGIYVVNDTLAFVTHNLPDGSTIKLNANSHIEYDSDFINNRKLDLVGEAFFEVEKGKSFVVHTDNGDVTVLGTSFNVFSRGNSINVACKTGKVMVKSDVEYILSPGDNIVSIDRKQTTKGEVNIDEIGAWQLGESKFESSPLNQVILALEAQYNVEVRGTFTDGNQKFTGSFVHNDLDKAVRMVFLPMGISYELDQKSKTIIIQ